MDMFGKAPQSGRDYYELGNQYLTQHLTKEALIAYEAAARLEPKQSAIPANIGVVLAEMGRIEEARQAYDKALSLERSGYAPYEFRKCFLQPVILDSSQAIDDERKRLQKGLKKISNSRPRLNDPQHEVGNPAFFLAYQGRNNRDIQVEIANTIAQACPGLRYRADFSHRSNRDKIKVGFFSAHFREHTVARVNLGLIKNLPRDRFEVVAIRPHGQKDSVTDMISAAADSTLVVAPTLLEARNGIERAELDILLFTDIGMEPLSYYLAFARLAPVQAALWGHPDTSGIKNVDYYVSTAMFEPAHAQSAYSERLVQLPRHYMCFEPPTEEVRKLGKDAFGASPAENVYLCPQSLFKLHPDNDALFDCLLKRDPKGVICIPSGTEDYWIQRLEKRFAKNCPETHERIRFIPRILPDTFRSMLASADVLIDPVHFTGGYTSYLSLSTASPIVTLPGEFLRGRMTSGLYRQMGIDSLVAHDIESYTEIAVRLANDPSWRKEQSDQIRDNSSAIFNDTESVLHFAEFLASAHAAAAKGTYVQ